MHSVSDPISDHTFAACPFCGDSPVNHWLTYLSESAEVLFHAATTFAVSSGLNQKFDDWAEQFARAHIAFCLLIGLARIGDDESKATSLRSKLIWREAKRRGIPMRQIFFLGRATDWYEAFLGGQRHYFASIPFPLSLPRAAYQWIDDKFVLKQNLRAAGIPVPRSFSVFSLSQALRAFSAIGGPVVVKPRTGSRGRHTTVFVTSEDDLVAAFKRARRLNHFVVVEEYLAGSVCRGTLVAGVLRGFLKADPPRVIGDGASTIRELIARKNQMRPALVAEVSIRQELTDFLARHGYSLDSVLPEGVSLAVLSRTGRLFGGTTREMLSEIHPRIRALLEKAGKVANAPVVGFDLIIPDPSRDPDGQKWGIIEGNSLPFIDLHDFALEGEPANVAAHIWDLWK